MALCGWVDVQLWTMGCSRKPIQSISSSDWLSRGLMWRCVCVLQNQDYRIQYEAVQRIFVLPKPNSPHTMVVAALDPPIRKVRYDVLPLKRFFSNTYVNPHTVLVATLDPPIRKMRCDVLPCLKNYHQNSICNPEDARMLTGG